MPHQLCPELWGFPFFFFFSRFYLFIWERERVREREHEQGQKEREKQTPVEQRAWGGAQTQDLEIMTPAEGRRLMEWATLVPWGVPFWVDIHEHQIFHCYIANNWKTWPPTSFEWVYFKPSLPADFRCQHHRTRSYHNNLCLAPLCGRWVGTVGVKSILEAIPYTSLPN